MSIPASTFDALLTTQYMSAVAVTVSIWDHLLRFVMEVELVWRQPMSIPSTVVLANAYGVELSMIYLAYVLSGLRAALTDLTCHVSVIFVGIYGTISIGISQLALVLRVYILWDNRYIARSMLIAGFVVCYGISATFSIIAAKNEAGTIQYALPLHECFLPSKSTYLTGTWAGMVLFDVYVLSLVIVNTLSQPRRRDSEIFAHLRRDGILTFVFVLAIRLIPLFQNIYGDASQTFTSMIAIWSLDNILCTRLYLKARLVEVRSKFSHLHAPGQPIVINEEISMTVM